MTMSPLPEPNALAGRLTAVQERVAAAAARAGRPASAVTLVAVSKGFDVPAVAAVRDAGQVDFGENRVQDLKAKARAVSGVRWHFIGRLQRNKVKDVVGLASLIHSVDRLELAEDLAARATRTQRVQRILVQVNVDGDPAKAGCLLADAPAFVAQVRALPGIACEGVMTIPAIDSDARAAFARLRELRNHLRNDFPEVQHLSMGMSNDFEVAVEEGATIVRVGQAVFGPRSDNMQPASPDSAVTAAVPAGQA